jgi:hypothetical protein
MRLFLIAKCRNDSAGSIPIEGEITDGVIGGPSF